MLSNSFLVENQREKSKHSLPLWLDDDMGILNANNGKAKLCPHCTSVNNLKMTLGNNSTIEN